MDRPARNERRGGLDEQRQDQRRHGRHDHGRLHRPTRDAYLPEPDGQRRLPDAFRRRRLLGRWRVRRRRRIRVLSRLPRRRRVHRLHGRYLQSAVGPCADRRGRQSIDQRAGFKPGYRLQPHGECGRDRPRFGGRRRLLPVHRSGRRRSGFQIVDTRFRHQHHFAGGRLHHAAGAQPTTTRAGGRRDRQPVRMLQFRIGHARFPGAGLRLQLHLQPAALQSFTHDHHR